MFIFCLYLVLCSWSSRGTINVYVGSSIILEKINLTLFALNYTYLIIKCIVYKNNNQSIDKILLY